ncbi:hypothetical protein KCU73_g8552, partial [Aureobasidium melanogenum]
MSTSESTILGLRTQILENWRYMYPGHTNVVILTTRQRKGYYTHVDRFEAIIAEDRSMGTRVFVKASSLGTYEAALRLLLDMTSDMMKSELEDQSAQLLNVKHLHPDITSTQQNNNETVKSTKKPTQNTNELAQSPEEVENNQVMFLNFFDGCRCLKISETTMSYNKDNFLPIASKQKVLIPNSFMTSLLALSIKVLESYLHSSTTKSLEATTHKDLRTQILDNWRYLYPFHTNVSVIVLTLEGRLWGHRYQAIITEDRIQDGKIFMATDPKD